MTLPCESHFKMAPIKNTIRFTIDLKLIKKSHASVRLQNLLT